MADTVTIGIRQNTDSVAVGVTGTERVELTINETGMRGPEGPEGPEGPGGTSQLEISGDPGNTVELRNGELFAEPQWTLTDW